jgi:streptogramin lyase
VIALEDGTLWVGNTFGSICRFDPAKETCIELYEDEKGMVGGLNAMVLDENGYLFYADDGEGISGFDGESWKSFILEEKPLSNRYEAITETPDGKIWLAARLACKSYPPTTPKASGK